MKKKMYRVSRSLSSFAETHLEPSETSKVELFTKIVNGFDCVLNALLEGHSFSTYAHLVHRQSAKFSEKLTFLDCLYNVFEVCYEVLVIH